VISSSVLGLVIGIISSFVQMPMVAKASAVLSVGVPSFSTLMFALNFANGNRALREKHNLLISNEQL
jgi:hypothetical protein